MSGNGFLAGHTLGANRIERERQARIDSGLALLDLTGSNPTAEGLLFPAKDLIRLAGSYLQARHYEPDPRGSAAARQAIADFYGKRTPPLAINAEHVVITASTSEAYALLFSLLGAPGSAVLGPGLSYPLFEMLAEHSRVRYLPFPLSGSPSCVDDAALESIIRDENPAALLFISPHNPTGRVIKEPSCAAAACGLPLICDEVFASFPLSVPSVPALGSLYPESPVFHLNGISKMFGLPDLKLGWIAMNERAYVQYGERLLLLNDCFLSSSSLIQSMLPGIFAAGAHFSGELLARIRSNISRAAARLAHPAFELELPDAGAFLFPRIRGAVDEEELVVELIRAGVYVHPGYFYGAEEGAHIFVSCLLEPGKLEAGLDVLVDVVNRRVRS